MSIKIICDRCKCEIDGRSDNYRKIYFMFGHDDDVEEYDLCPDCFTSIKRSIANNLLEYEHSSLEACNMRNAQERAVQALRYKIFKEGGDVFVEEGDRQ